jgi:alpha-glucosidase
MLAADGERWGWMAEDWWRGAVIYQIYPRSFCDADGDGVGDLRGIAARLPHIAALGADAVWIAPFFPSPMQDFGYDVSDYRGVDPRFGTLADVDAVVAEAHRLGLKVIIDQVWSHSSDRHPWFLESASDRTGPKADWYVWADAKPDGTPPNNWLSVFGGPAWRWDPRRRQYYLHHFLPSQPKLNLRNPRVLDALIEAGDFWLRRGVDGFRLDAVDFMIHDAGLRDNPPRPPADGIMPVKPFGMQRHAWDMAQPETLDVMRCIRGLLDRHPGTTTIAEVSSEYDALRRAATYTRGDGGLLHMAYTLRLMKTEFTAEQLTAAIAQVEERFDDGWMCWAFSNHDVVRVASRWGDGSPAFAKLGLALLLSLRGSVCLYQGEELGLTEADLPFEALQDPYGLNFWPQFKGRDGCRTPIPWRQGAPHAGFTTATPWLPVPAEHHAMAVDVQEADPGSVLSFARAFMAWRRAQPALLRGELRLLPAGHDLVAFERRAQGQRLYCVFNTARQPRAVTLAPGWSPVAAPGSAPERDGEAFTIAGRGWLFAAPPD